MRKTTSATTTILAIQKRIFWGFIICILALFCSYGYFVSMSIVNVLVREEIEHDIASAHSALSQLEFAYLEKKNNINLEFAYLQGFENIEEKTFVARKSFLGQGLSVNSGI